MKEINGPKRRKSKDNPYIINHIENNNTYIVIFKNNNKEEKVQISKDVYDAFNQFELKDIRQLHEYEIHIEHSEIFDYSLYKRAVNTPKSVDCIVEEKIFISKIKEALEQLSDVQKRRLKMYYFEDMKLEEIALLENTTHQAISKSIRKGIEEIKKNIKN